MTAIVFFSMLTCTVAHAQTTRVTNIDTASNMKEKYCVLKSNKSIKEGSYSAYNPYDEKLLTEGFYKNNLKDSVWKEYGYKGLIETGAYKNGRKVGIWNAYDSKGDAVLQYDYTNSKLLLFKPEGADTSRDYFIINGADTLNTLVDRQPIYLDGMEMAFRKLLRKIRYPMKARMNNITGKVYIGFTIGTDGKTSGYHVVKSLGSGCDEAAIVAVKAIDGDWLPAMLNGKPVAVVNIVPISFSLNGR